MNFAVTLCVLIACAIAHAKSIDDGTSNYENAVEPFHMSPVQQEQKKDDGLAEQRQANEVNGDAIAVEIDVEANDRGEEFSENSSEYFLLRVTRDQLQDIIRALEVAKSSNEIKPLFAADESNSIEAEMVDFKDPTINVIYEPMMKGQESIMIIGRPYEFGNSVDSESAAPIMPSEMLSKLILLASTIDGLVNKAEEPTTMSYFEMLDQLIEKALSANRKAEESTTPRSSIMLDTLIGWVEAFGDQLHKNVEEATTMTYSEMFNQLIEKAAANDRSVVKTEEPMSFTELVDKYVAEVAKDELSKSNAEESTTKKSSGLLSTLMSMVAMFGEPGKKTEESMPMSFNELADKYYTTEAAIGELSKSNAEESTANKSSGLLSTLMSMVAMFGEPGKKTEESVTKTEESTPISFIELVDQYLKDEVDEVPKSKAEKSATQKYSETLGQLILEVSDQLDRKTADASASFEDETVARKKNIINDNQMKAVSNTRRRSSIGLKMPAYGIDLISDTTDSYESKLFADEEDDNNSTLNGQDPDDVVDSGDLESPEDAVQPDPVETTTSSSGTKEAGGTSGKIDKRKLKSWLQEQVRVKNEKDSSK